jgi:hypothetical protein
MIKIAAERIESRGPEFFIARQPHGGLLQGFRRQLAADHATFLRPLDQTRVFKDAQMFDESGERHGVRLRELGHAQRAFAQCEQNVAPRAVRQRREHAIEVALITARQRVNHKVQYRSDGYACQGLQWTFCVVASVGTMAENVDRRCIAPLCACRHALRPRGKLRRRWQ